MITVDQKSINEEIRRGLSALRTVVKDVPAARAMATALEAGGKVIAAKARTLAPKRGRLKRGSKTKTYGKTGLLRKSIKTKKGITKKGNVPFCAIGPSKSVKEIVQRGKKQVEQRPAYYSHLVEYGFKAHHRVPLVTGRQHETIVKKGILWQGRDLEKYMKKTGLKKDMLTKGKAFRTAAFIASKKGQGSSSVAGKHFMQKASDQGSAASVPPIVQRLTVEMAKILKRIESRRRK